MLKNCPFCGCKMERNEQYPIYGEHKKNCFFFILDNQNRFDFTKNEDLFRLYDAWNKRVSEKKETTTHEAIKLLDANRP